jgi:hypothetical protein
MPPLERRAVARALLPSQPMRATKALLLIPVPAAWLAVAATAAGVVARARPVAGSTLMALGGLLGAGAISLFSIDTFYWAAVPLWLLAAVLALAGPHRTR